MSTKERAWGHELKVGDVIDVIWEPHRDTITEMKPYNGPLAYLWPDGAKIASFAINRTGMTIEPWAIFDRLGSAQHDRQG